MPDEAMDDTPAQPTDRRRRPPFWLVSAGVFLLVTLALFGDVLLSRGDKLLGNPDGDMPNYYLPVREYGFAALRARRLPTWNPHVFSGMPFLADIQTALFYPPNWVHFLLPSVTAINLTIAAHFWLAAWSMSLWAYSRTRSAPAALLAGAVFACCGGYYFHLYVGHLTLLCAGAWIPLLFLCADAYLADAAPRQRLRWLLLGSVAVAMQILSGHPQTLYLTAVAVSLYVLARLPGSKSKLATVVSTGAMFVLGAALSAVQLLPTLALTPATTRAAGLGEHAAYQSAMPPENLATLAMPHFLGRPPEYIGRTYPTEVSMFVGAITLLLAAYALLAHKPNRLLLPVLILLVLMSGVSETLFHYFRLIVPGYATFRGMGRFAIVIDALLAVLAADGLALLIRNGVPTKKFTVTTTAVALALATPAALLQVTDRPWRAFLHRLANAPHNLLPPAAYDNPKLIAQMRHVLQTQCLLAAGTLALLTILLLLWRLRPHLSTACAWLIALLAAADVLSTAAVDRITGPPRNPVPRAWTDATPTDDGRVVTVPLDTADYGLLDGHLDAGGYNPIILDRYARFLAISQGLDPAGEVDFAPTFKRPSTLFAPLRVDQVRFTRNGQPGRMVLAGEFAPMPRFAFLHHYRLTPTRPALYSALADTNFDARKTALLESEPSPNPDPDAPNGATKVIASTPERIDVEATTQYPAILLITDPCAPGWTVTSLSQNNPQPRYDLLPADLTLRAVPLSTGTHHLRFEYHAPGLAAGAYLSTATAILMAAAAIVLSLRTRGPRHAAAQLRDPLERP